MLDSIMPILVPVVTVLVIAAIIIAVIMIIAKIMYKKAAPNVAMLVTGPGGCKTVIGKGCFVIPILQRVDYLSLENIQSDFTSRDEIPTRDAINIMVDAVANVSVSQNPELLKIAASKFIGYKPEQIREIIFHLHFLPLLSSAPAVPSISRSRATARCALVSTRDTLMCIAAAISRDGCPR